MDDDDAAAGRLVLAPQTNDLFIAHCSELIKTMRTSIVYNETYY